MKNLFFGLSAVVMAFSMSAFTNVTKLSTGDVYGSQAGSTSAYTLREDAYNSGACTPDSKICAYIVTSDGASTVTANSYTQAELEDFADASPALVTRSAQTGIYSGN